MSEQIIAKKLTVWIPDDLHKELKIEAANLEKTLTDTVVERLKRGKPKPK